MRNTLFTPDDTGPRSGLRGRPVSRPSVYKETSKAPQAKDKTDGTPEGTPEGSPRNGSPTNIKKDLREPAGDDNAPGKTQGGKDLRRTDADHDREDNQSPTQTPRGQVPDSIKEKRPLDSQRETKDKKPSGDEKSEGPKSSKRPKSEDKKDSAKSTDKPKPSKKPEEEVNPELKLNTAVRDWQVNIQEVRVTNMLSDPQSIFLVFKIGDSFKKVDTLTENGKLITIDTGKRGITFVSEIQDNINRDDSRLLTVTVRTNYRGSYADLQKEDLVISAWKYNTWLVNTYCGEVRIPLIKVVTENVCRADEIKIKHEGRMKKSLRVNYRCYFQEIWNYRLTFSDFKITNLQHNDGKPYSTNVEFSLPSGGTFSIGKSVKTDTIKQDKNPLWETIKGEISFKGPLYELEDKDMDVVIRDSSGLKKGPVCSSRISLKGLSTKGSIRVPVKVTLSSNSGNKTEVRGTRGGSAKDPRDTAGKKRDDDEIGMDFYYTYLEGRVTIPEKPKYFQKGDSLILRAGGRYLCVQVGKLENIHPPETIGMVNSFVTVHWGNQRNSTRTIMDDFSPTFNEEMHFKISLDKDERDPKFYEELKNNLKSRAEITAYVWLDPKNGGFENIGYCKCTLSEIMAGFIDEKGFYDFENKAQVKKNCRVATVKKQVISSIVESSNTFLNLSFYLFPDYPADKMDVGELTKVEGDKVDPLVYKAIKDGVNSEPWKTHTSFISQVFGEDLQTFREQNFQFIFAVDQCNLTRFLPTYLDTFTMDFQPPKAPEYELSQVVTCKDVFAFVNNIPFVDEYKKSDLIASPEFTLTQNKGSQADHVVLLACLMMGCTYETQDEIGKLKQLVETYSKEMVSFENRVFVCVGTNKFSTKRELWLMTYSRDLTSVTMWDVKTALCYELKGRVSESNAKLLKKYLTYDPSKDLENTGEAILEILNKLAQDDAPEDEKQEEDESEQSSLKFDLDQILGQDNYEAIVDPELNRQLYRYTALEREDRAAGGYEFMQNKAKSQMKGGHNSKNREAIHDFFQKGKKVNSAELIPWESIELIFNHKNIWANVQYMNPTKIMYEIYNPAQWRCFLSIYNGKNEIPWLNKVGAFHNIPALEAPIDAEDIHRYEAIVMKDIKFTITQQRSALNKETRFRSPKDKLSTLLKEYLKVMHVFECSKKSEKQILEDGEGVARKMKELIPRDYKLCYLPLRFSILDTERIQSIIAENFSDFFMQVKDPCMFAAACKIFPFPNKINSLRIIICSVSKITRGEFDLSEEEADDLDDETKWDLGKTTDLGLKDEHFYHEN